MAFWLLGKVVALQLDNSTGKAYLCNQGGTASLFFPRLVCCILRSHMHGTTLILTYIPTHLNVEANYLSLGVFIPEWHPFLHIAQAVFQLRGELKVDMLASLCTNQCHHNYTLENTLLLEALVLNTFNHPCTNEVSCVFPPPSLVPPVLSKFLTEHVTD